MKKRRPRPELVPDTDQAEDYSDAIQNYPGVLCCPGPNDTTHLVGTLPRSGRVLVTLQISEDEHSSVRRAAMLAMQALLDLVEPRTQLALVREL